VDREGATVISAIGLLLIGAVSEGKAAAVVQHLPLGSPASAMTKSSVITPTRAIRGGPTLPCSATILQVRPHLVSLRFIHVLIIQV